MIAFGTTELTNLASSAITLPGLFSNITLNVVAFKIAKFARMFMLVVEIGNSYYLVSSTGGNVATLYIILQGFC